MSFRGNLLRAGIDSDGKVVTVYRNDGRLDILTAASKTTGTIRSAIITHTEGANSMSRINETLRVTYESEYYTGDWVNAIVGRIDYGDAGDARGGMAAAICAEMNMPGKSYASIGGPCYSLDCEFNCPTSFVAGDRTVYPIAFINFGLWGGAKGQFDDEGYIFHTDGLTAGSGHVLSANSRTLRVNIEGTDKYVYLSDTEDDLGAMVVDSITITSATGGKIAGTVTAETAVDPGRHLYLQRTYTGIISSAGLTGVEVRSTFNGSANSTSMEVKGGEFKARHTNANTKNVGTFKGVIGNCDSKSGAKTITSAWAVEGQIDCGTGSTITTAAGCRVAYNEDGTVTNAYGIYVDGTSVWDVGVKITDGKAVVGIDIGNVTTGISLTGTIGTSGISFCSATFPVASDNVSLINIGTYDTGISSAASSDNTFAVMNNRISTADDAYWFMNEYMKISATTADQTSKNFCNLAIRQAISKPVASTYGIQSHLTFATTGDTSSEVVALSAQINGTHAGSGLHWGVKSDLRHAGCPTAEQMSACFFGVGTVNCGSGVFIEALDGKTMAAGIRLHAAGTITTAISTAGGTITNLLSTFITNGPAVATAEAGDGAGSIKILVDGVAKYLHYWANVS